MTLRRQPYRFSEAGRCHWCGEPVRPPRRSWCSDKCVEEYQALQPDFLRRAVFERDHGVCAICGTDCEQLRERLTQRLRGLVLRADGTHWYLEVRHRWRWHKLLRRVGVRVWALQKLARSLWDADHTVPLVEGGANTLDNLRTLCLWCHKQETRALAGRRAAARNEARP